jgi:hypothetical protein
MARALTPVTTGFALWGGGFLSRRAGKPRAGEGDASKGPTATVPLLRSRNPALRLIGFILMVILMVGATGIEPVTPTMST